LSDSCRGGSTSIFKPTPLRFAARLMPAVRRLYYCVEDQMKTIGLALLIGLAGYVIGVILGMIGIKLLSPNRHDKSVEAAMTSFFFVGPALAIVSVVVFLLTRQVR
jgi:F0F1-type ATP synthase membrane subunit c/vacuolar-type H+-ATPase subunit K